MEQCKLLTMVSFILWIILISVEQAGTSCVLPPVLANSVWMYSQNVTTGQVNFGQSTMAGFGVTARGNELKDYHCISNATYVYVFKSDGTYSDRGKDRLIYRCMKVTKVTANLVYLYFLSDVDKTVNPASRVFSPPADNVQADDQATCNFCRYTQPPKAEEYFLLKRQNTDEKMTMTPTPCLPCDADCANDPCDPNPCQNGGSCTSGTDGYNCTCSSGWNNKNCSDAMGDQQPESQSLHPVVIAIIIIVGVLAVIIIILVVRFGMRKSRNSSNKKYEVPLDNKAEVQNTD